MRSVEEIRSSIKDLIQKAENEELLKVQSSDNNQVKQEESIENDPGSPGP